MSFFSVMEAFSDFDVEEHCASVTAGMVERTLNREGPLTELELCALLSDAADGLLEAMAQKAARVTRTHFGSSVVLFTPMYISNYCDNRCPYCSFAHSHRIVRNHLNHDEIAREAERIRANGIRHLLMLTGESPAKVSIEYLEKAVSQLRDSFASVAIEIYPLSEEHYDRLVAAGADMLTLYQETYDRPRYEQLHRGGPKADYLFRLGAPERACRSGMRSVTVGALYGLHNWRTDAFFTALHAAWLHKNFPAVEMSISLPRLRPQAGTFSPYCVVNDRQFVRMLAAFRIFLPYAGITISTRESAAFRMSVLPLGVTRMSAGVSTGVGGHGDPTSTPQFEIADTRDVPTVRADLLAAGFQPVMHDWNVSLFR